MKRTLEKLYTHNFDWIPVDVLGNAYELYIGTIIKEKQGKLNSQELSLVEAPAIRKKFGIYYTPTAVVDFIISNSLATRLAQCSSAEEISKIKIIDPAAGSGSFLIRAFDYLLAWYSRSRNSGGDHGLKPYVDPVPHARKRILLDNLYGVDLDPQAVEVVMLNLGLKSIERNDKLPHLYDKIRWGNSIIDYVKSPNPSSFDKVQQILSLRTKLRDLDLSISNATPRSVSGVEGEVNSLIMQRDSLLLAQETMKEELKADLNDSITETTVFDSLEAKRPFHWQNEFPEVFQAGGFDFVIANPPYYNIQTVEDMEEKNWIKNAFPDVFTGESDIHYFFYARGLQILKESGVLGFISSRYFIEAAQAQPFRKYLQTNSRIKMIVDFGSVIKIFRDATINTVILIVEKCTDKKALAGNIIKVVKVNNWDDDVDKLIFHISASIENHQYHDAYISIFELPQDNLRAEMWVLTTKSADEIFQKMKARGTPLSQYCDVFKSIASGLDQISQAHIELARKAKLSFASPLTKGEEVFRVSERTVKNRDLEEVVCKRLIKNQDVRRYLITLRDEYLIFLTKEDQVDKYPNVRNHLNRYRPLLERRYDSIRSAPR